MPHPEYTHPTDDAVVLDDLPEYVESSMRQRDEWIRDRRRNNDGLEFIVSDVQRWVPGQVVRVAFLDGSTPLYEDIEEATQAITEACNLRLDFRDPATGDLRRWTEQDTEYAAEIRVSFDRGGYFSLVGIDSINRAIGGDGQPVGGGPNQRSLNLGGFTAQRPASWRGTTRHEFLHALSFHHSHQNMRGPCEGAFRWEDDEGYQPTRDARGVFIPDVGGRRPGIYTYLSGPPNGWGRAKVDHNLRTQVDDPDVVAGPFDGASVMLYRFPPLFYRTVPSACAPTTDGIELSEGDRRGLRLLYPVAAADAGTVVESRRRRIVEDLDQRHAAASAHARGGLESAPQPGDRYGRETAAALERSLAGPR